LKQLTIRGFDEDLKREVMRLARREGISLNRAVLRLLRKGAGLDNRKDSPHLVGSSLDWFIGSWSEDEAEPIETALRDFEEIDESMWR
jgi:hypothetical protein